MIPINPTTAAILETLTQPRWSLEKARSSYQEVPEHPGLYAVWWIAGHEQLLALNREVHFHGKRVSAEEALQRPDLAEKDYHPHKTVWKLEHSGPVCVYVGKASNIRKRIRQQIDARPGLNNWYVPFSIRRNGKNVQQAGDAGQQVLVKRTSGCQVRAGIEHLFKGRQAASLEEKLGCFSLAWAEQACFEERFYAEDLAIGMFRPWFNLDCER